MRMCGCVYMGMMVCVMARMFMCGVGVYEESVCLCIRDGGPCGHRYDGVGI